MKIYFKTFDAGKIKNIEFASLDFNCLTPVLMIDVNTNLEGNINSSMAEYTKDANRSLIENSYNGVDFLRSVPKNYREEASLYPEKLSCRSKSDAQMNTDESNNAIFEKPYVIFTGIILSSVLLLVRNRAVRKKRKLM